MTDDRNEIDPCEARLRQAVLQLSERDAELSNLRAENEALKTERDAYQGIVIDIANEYRTEDEVDHEDIARRCVRIARAALHPKPDLKNKSGNI